VEDPKKISDELSATGQVTPEQLQKAAEAGFKSVLNLRSPQEAGVLPDEQQQAEAAGLNYANVPLDPSAANSDQISLTLQELDSLPKPVLLHCGAGLRAGAIALIATAIKEGLTPEQVTVQAEQIGLNPGQPHLKQFILEQKDLNNANENLSD
jgi:uncharacterized protein (TIGR01244 family)